MLTYALLGFLRYAPMTGYDLKQIMDLSTSNFWHAKQSQIYTTLKKLEAKGQVQSEIEPQQGRPDRRVYSITPVGEQALTDWLDAPLEEIEPRKETLLLKLFFAAPTGKDALLGQLGVQRELHQRMLDTYRHETRQVIDQFASQMPEHQADAILWDATRRFGEMFEEMYLAWLAETMAVIEAKLDE